VRGVLRGSSLGARLAAFAGASGLAGDWSVSIAVVTFFVGRLHLRNSWWKVKVALRWVFVGERLFATPESCCSEVLRSKVLRSKVLRSKVLRSKVLRSGGSSFEV
jgi:hypothetical protein